MCGINGILKKYVLEGEELLNELKVMNSCIRHRGPDQDGYFIESLRGISVGMAMQRLSIIDLSSGKQPIFSSDKQIVIVFNGEIYNYLPLREQLLKDGYHFDTNSDTEVILKLYEKHGVKSFSMLDGMFAFSIYDKNVNKVFIARDFFGEKPLYYYADDKSFCYGSELKSIIKILDVKPEISKEGLNLYFQLTYIPAPFTIYQNISKLEANHYIEFDCANFSFSIVQIIQSFKKYNLPTFKEAVSITKELVYDSVVSRSISDVPLGTFLSGGVDSSIVSWSLAQQRATPIDTFSIGFDKKAFDETDKSRQVAKMIGSNHHEFVIGEKDLSEHLDEIVLNFDEPFADSSALASFIVSKKTKQFVKVALTGDGGDEVFGGYNKYYIGKMNQTYINFIPQAVHFMMSNSLQKLLSTKDDNRGLLFKLKRLVSAVNYEGDFYYNIISLGYQEEELNGLFIKNWSSTDGFSYFRRKIGNNNSTITDFRNIDRHISLEGDMLVKVDRTSMLNSLECRAPFLNKEIWNFTSQIPERYLINKWDKKHILKEAFKEHFPANFLDKSKKGFGVPVGDWLRNDLKNELESYIEESFLLRQSIFNQSVIVPLVKNHLSGKIDNTFRVWPFYCFQKWYKNRYEA